MGTTHEKVLLMQILIYFLRQKLFFFTNFDGLRHLLKFLVFSCDLVPGEQSYQFSATFGEKQNLNFFDVFLEKKRFIINRTELTSQPPPCVVICAGDVVSVSIIGIYQIIQHVNKK